MSREQTFLLALGLLIAAAAFVSASGSCSSAIGARGVPPSPITRPPRH